ncbi:exonuclease domain-containing protein [Brachybacterium sp. GCM10030268]|uniref:exonuclease domain-containing protein n=1 Tax=Brachybacterium sp. GCM10030268 TaxID=3273382 RepID=UPI00361EA496
MIDVETTGLSPADERIIELAIIRADVHGRPIDQWVARFRPEKPVGATHVHGITDEDVAHAPRFAEHAQFIGTALQGMVVVAHNAEFDASFLRAEFARASMPIPAFTPYCTLQGSSLYLPHLQRRKLSDCCAALGVTIQKAHSALGDALATADLLQRYLALDAQTGYDAPLTATRALRAREIANRGEPSAPVAPPIASVPPPAPREASAPTGALAPSTSSSALSPRPAPRSPAAPAPDRLARTSDAPAAPEPLPLDPARPTGAASVADDPEPVGGTVSPAVVRAWARENGIPVGDRGRLSAEIVNQYKASTGRSETPTPTVAPMPAPAPESPTTTAPQPAPRPAVVKRSATRLTITPEFQAALDHLHAGHHLFLTGKAGTGKSTLIRHYLEATERRTITVAPTGIAALNVDGYTIHRLFSFPKGVTEETVRGPGYYPGRFAKALKELDTLIVDEASMVRADLFDALTAALERFGPRPGTPFGGVQLVLVGDLYQLPPVVTDGEAAWIEERFGTPFFFSARSFEPSTFPVVELGTVFRQLGDNRLVDLLNAVREGALLEEARAELNQRTAPDFEPDLDEFWLTLATTNRIVGARNRQMLERLPDPAQVFAAQVSGETDGIEHPTDDSLSIAVGAQIMMLTNHPTNRWVNGTLGRITAIETDEDGPLVTVLLRDGRSEQVRRHTWDITRPSVRGGSLVHEVIGTFTQLPMKLAWAITIHKSQGQTLDRVVVDLTGGTFANGQLYVALSRCTSLEGLVLKREVLPRDLKADVRVRRYLATGAASTATLGEAYLAVLTVGNEGGRWRPRPIEIAVVTDDGDEATTVINPTSDLYSAHADYGLTTRDVQLAPLLKEAWPALSSVLAGRVPVGLDIDRQLAQIDFELKRNGIVEPMPLGLDLPTTMLSSDELARLQAPTALERARAVRGAAQRVRGTGTELPGTGTAFRQLTHGHGYLLARTTGPYGSTDPASFVVGGNLTAEDDAADVLAGLLREAWDRVLHCDQEVTERMRQVDLHFGVNVLPADQDVAGPVDVTALLVPGTRLCFSGTVESLVHGRVEKEELHDLAEGWGLVPVPTVTKTKTDVLVVAEAGSQSSKTKNAAKWGKPVIVAEDFLGWARR